MGTISRSYKVSRGDKFSLGAFRCGRKRLVTETLVAGSGIAWPVRSHCVSVSFVVLDVVAEVLGKDEGEGEDEGGEVVMWRSIVT